MSKGFRIVRAVPYVLMAVNVPRLVTAPEPSSTLASSCNRWWTLTIGQEKARHRGGTTALVQMEVVTRQRGKGIIVVGDETLFTYS